MRPGRQGPICGPERTNNATQGPAREEVSSLVWVWRKAGTFETHTNTLSHPKWDQGTALWASFVSPRLPPTLRWYFWPPSRQTSLSLEKILRWQNLRCCNWGFPWSPFLLEVSVLASIAAAVSLHGYEHSKHCSGIFSDGLGTREDAGLPGAACAGASADELAGVRRRAGPESRPHCGLWQLRPATRGRAPQEWAWAETTINLCFKILVKFSVLFCFV